MARSKGEGSIYQRKSDGMWCATIELPPAVDGRRRRKQIVRKYKQDLVTEMRKVKSELAERGDLPTSSPTVEQWLTYWLREVSARRCRPKTQYEREGDVRRYLLPTLGKVRLDKLTADHVRKMHNHITDELGLSSTTALRCHRILSVALRDAKRAGRVTRNVATSDYLDAPSAAVVDVTTLTQDQALAVLATAARRPDGARWALSLLTGARAGEALGLEWDRVDFDTGTLTFSWQLQRLTWTHGCGDTPCRFKRAGNCPYRQLRIPAGFEHRQIGDGGLYLVRPKTRTGWRVVPLVDPLFSILERHHNQQGNPTGGLVFGTVDPRDDYQGWLSLLAEAGVPRIRRHDARHTAATLLLALGVDTKVISQILGHSSVVTTRAYQHASLDMARAALTQLGAHLTAIEP